MPIDFKIKFDKSYSLKNRTCEDLINFKFVIIEFFKDIMLYMHLVATIIIIFSSTFIILRT